MATEKFVRVFDRTEIYLTACAVTKNTAGSSLLGLGEFGDYYFGKPNQFWKRDRNHERALLKIYKRNHQSEHLTCYDNVQTLKIPMPFWGNNSADGWGELQFLIKNLAAVKLARRSSFDTRVNKWVNETQPIQPKTNLETHAYLALRFYHLSYLPPVPDDWRFEPVYISVRNSNFYRIDVLWEEAEIKITITALGCDSPEIPKYLK